MTQDIADRVKQIVAEQLGVKVTEVGEDVRFSQRGRSARDSPASVCKVGGPSPP